TSSLEQFSKGNMSRVLHHMTEDGLSVTSELSYDPYAELPDHCTTAAPAVPTSQRTTHMPYGAYGQQQQQQQQYVTVVHHNGRMAWVPYQEGATMGTLREEVGRQLGVNASLNQFARACPLMEDTPFTRQCMPNDVLYILPDAVPKSTLHEMLPPPLPLYQPREVPSAPATPLLPVSVPTTPVSGSGSFTSAMFPHPHGPSFSGNSTPLSMPVAAPTWTVQLEEKLANAAANLSQVISQSRQCTELQQDLETAVNRGVDCSCVFQACERSLGELILHPSGNYLVSKCFDLCSALIDSATSIIAGDVRTFALHKHGSYVVEAILTSTNASKQCKGELILALINPTNRVNVATHDSGNFVLQKAIDNCPEEMLPQLQEAVQAVVHMSTHGPKMLKKLESRLSKWQGANAAAMAKASMNTLPLPPSTAAYLSQVNQKVSVAPLAQKQAPHVPVVCASYMKCATIEGSVHDSKTAAESLDTRKQGPVYPERGQFVNSWADAEDDPLSPPRLFTERAALP
ncbi:hypothetical protein DIPPA_25190, partial [Diplonema papillatum]